MTFAIVLGRASVSIPTRKIMLRGRYRPRQTNAGRWVEAPVAELDKSTFGKLLASRVKREPRLRVVPSNPPPASLDALYDAELDG